MVAIATREGGLKDKETGDEFLRLRKELLRYDKIVPPPDVVRKASDAWSFWHEASKGRGTYDERRAYIEESFTRYYANRLVSGEQVDLAAFLRARDLVLGEQVGGGGFGEVFRAEHTIAGSRAVKVFRPHFYDGNREALQRFNREANILARLAHPRIVRFFDAGVAPGPRPFIITEFIDGDSLESQLKKRSVFDPREALDICAQVLEALGSAHALGIIHRDIKPNNIMWSNGTATLLDLGSGGVMSDVITTRLTVDAQGTMGYMAPELIDDPTLLDPRTDVYSVGVLLHRLLTGRALQPGDPGHYLVQTNAPIGVLDVLRRAVAPVAQRYQTSEEMADAVREFLGSSGGTSLASRTAQRASAGSFLTRPQDILAAIGQKRSTVMPSEWLQWARAELIGAVNTGRQRLPTRILRVVAVLTDIPQALGYDSLDWVDQDDVAHTARTIFGLIDNIAMDKLSESVNASLADAVKMGLLQVSEYDAWQPGMSSGSGMRDQYTVTPLGSKTLSDLGFATTPSPGSREPAF